MPLVNYGSSSEEEEEEKELHREGGHVALQNNKVTAKRPSQPSDASVINKKPRSGLPPLPSTLIDFFKDKRRPPEDTAKHQGRIRTRPHIEGSWPVHVYLGIKLPSDMFEIVLSLIKSARVTVPGIESLLHSIEAKKDPRSIPIEAKYAEDCSELHISLTRQIYLQELHIGRFISDVRDAFKTKKKFNLSFSGVQSFSNEENTRSFLSLRVGSGHAEIKGFVDEMDVIVKRYSQPTFYEDSQFHSSFAWAVGGEVLNEETVKAMTELENDLGDELRHCTMSIRSVSWKTGQKTGSIQLI